jgi:hypothetical protein
MGAVAPPEVNFFGGEEPELLEAWKPTPSKAIAADIEIGRRSMSGDLG